MRRSLIALSAFVASCQCGSNGLCEAVKCHAGFTCDPMSGICHEDANGGGTAATGGGSAASGGGSTASGGSGGGGGAASSGGGTASSGGGTSSSGGGGTTDPCSPACSGFTPFCDMSGMTPKCVQCRGNPDCSGGELCDSVLHTCYMQSGSGGAGGNGGGSGLGGVMFDGDGGSPVACLQNGPPTQCTTECSRGYICQSGQCVLRGSGGPVQVTLRFDQDEDLDLHVVEPLPDGGNCEIWYGDPSREPDAGQICFGTICLPPPPASMCGAQGWLDLDSNAACMLDHVDVENVIYPNGGVAPPGHYIVRVDDYDHCDGNPVNYEVEVRANGQTQYFCGTFYPGMSDSGGLGSGVFVCGFTVP